MLPDVIVIGAMKCATTSLHYYLGLHPDVAMVAEKELHFFVAERNWSKGLAWYQRQFVGRTAVHGESSTTYTRFPDYPGVPARMHRLVPNARLIYLVRDPIDRAVSHYVHEWAAGREHRPLAEAFRDLSGSPYLSFSRYAMQLEQYLPFYSPESILVLTSEELGARRTETMQRVFRFLGVRDFYHRRFAVVKHRSRSKRRLSPTGGRLAWLPDTGLAKRLAPSLRRVLWRLLSLPFSSRVDPPDLDADLRRRLVDALLPDLERFRRLTGRPFDGWLG